MDDRLDPRSQHGHRDALERASDDPFVWEVFSLWQCNSALIQWFGNEPPFTVTIHTADSGWYSLRDDTHLSLWDTLERNTTNAQRYWTVNVPSGTSVSVRVVDAIGRNYTTYPKIVGRSDDTSCLPTSLQPSPSSRPEVTYNYNLNNNSRLLTSIILAAIGGAITLIIILAIVCICRRRDKKRQKERQEQDATARPTYAQFYPYPGAEPVVYVQLVPGAPYVPMGASPEAVASTPQPGAVVDPNTPLSRAPSPAMSQVSRGVTISGTPNAVASGSGTHATELAAPTSSEPHMTGPLGFNVPANTSTSSLGTGPSRRA